MRCLSLPNCIIPFEKNRKSHTAYDSLLSEPTTVSTATAVFLCSVVNDFLFDISLLTKRRSGADSHRMANSRHKRPHQRIPWSHRTGVDRARLIWNECCPVDGAHRIRSVIGRLPDC